MMSDVRAGWRHSRLARYHVYDYAEWAPAGAGLVFVHDNDIYYKPRVLKTLVCRITSNGVVFNGVPDFLYETEVLRLDRALWFSPDGQTLMYVTYNDSMVPEYQYPWYGFDQLEPPPYPSLRTLRYPQVNRNNPEATIYVVSLKTPKFLFSHAIQFTSQVDKGWYIRWSSWLDEKQIAVLLLNRPQNVSVISICSSVHYNCQDIYRDETDGTRWSGLGSEPADEECGWCEGAALLAGKSGVFTSIPITDQGGVWRHAVQLYRDVRTTLTQGSFEVPTDGWPPAPQCLTCPGKPPDEQPDLTTDHTEYDNITSSLPAWPTSTVLPHVSDQNDSLPDLIYLLTFSLFVYPQECLGPGPPAIFLCTAGGVRRAVLDDGEPLRRHLARLAAPHTKVFRVEVQAHREARVRLLLPPGLRDTDDLPLPLVLHISAEPGGQLVTSRWRAGWSWYLATARNFIVAEIDARGSAGQGEELRTEVYQKLLSVDVEDQMAVLSYLRANLKMVDGNRIGVWGRGYGAAAALALAALNITRCVALLAHSYWTERYGGSEASRGAGAVWRRAGNVSPRRALIAHATADTRAPPHHAMSLARALVTAGALYTHHVRKPL
ncbi:unnamed protein product [Leptidea sinapis]|uniref:Peptidase S9 prolyl oligopeptidase catalytic domain-containing protein n=1 Tax=Leptidea sinapis TaxID=189913 RepID=A0A5E4PXC9_9NEOP|nr:unnamed protein product [Leptidea sinapis]